MPPPDKLTADLLPATLGPQLATLADGSAVWIELYIDTVSGVVKGRVTQPPPDEP